jgi:hypothetical protein
MLTSVVTGSLAIVMTGLAAFVTGSREGPFTGRTKAWCNRLGVMGMLSRWPLRFVVLKVILIFDKPTDVQVGEVVDNHVLVGVGFVLVSDNRQRFREYLVLDAKL